MPCVEKSSVFVYCAPNDCETYLQVLRELKESHYDFDFLALHWDGVDDATEDELAAFDAADYRLLIDLHGPGNQALQQMFHRALRTGKPTIEVSRTGEQVERQFPQGHVVRRVRVGANLAEDVCKAVKEAGWRDRQPWRVTALAVLLVKLLDPLRPLEILKTLIPCLRHPDKDAADWWAPLSAGVALGWWLLTRLYRLLIVVLLPWPPLARATFDGLVALPLVFACLEILSIVVIQVDILLVARRRDERKKGQAYRRVSTERALLCALLNYATIVFWFASFYQWFPWLFTMERGGLLLTRPLGALYVSLANMSLMGASVQPSHPCGRLILLAQLALGLFMALVVIAQAVGSIQHRSMDES
jgi:hypothetical protein